MHRGPRTFEVAVHVLCSLHGDDGSDWIMVYKNTLVMSLKVTYTFVSASVTYGACRYVHTGSNMSASTSVSEFLFL